MVQKCRGFWQIYADTGQLWIHIETPVMSWKTSHLLSNTPNSGYTTPVKKHSSHQLVSRGSDGWLSDHVHGSTPSTPTVSPKHIFDSNRECQLLILSALKGDEQGFEARQKAVLLIDSMDDGKRFELIDFLFAQNGIVASTLENNACKHFECSSEELNGVLDHDTLDSLSVLWKKNYQHILPHFLAMVYNLERHDSRLQIRKQFLIFFRDKVLVKVLSRISFDEANVAKLYPILLPVDVQTTSNSRKYLLFKTLMNSLLGSAAPARRFSVLSDADDSLSPLPVLKPSRRSIPQRLNRQTSEAALTTGKGTFALVSHARQTSLNLDEKNRANTLPTAPKRSVHFNETIECGFDDESTVDV